MKHCNRKHCLCCDYWEKELEQKQFAFQTLSDNYNRLEKELEDLENNYEELSKEVKKNVLYWQELAKINGNFKLHEENQKLKKEVQWLKNTHADDIDSLIKQRDDLEKNTREVVRKVIWKIAQDEGGQILHYNEWVDNNWKKLKEKK